jgi:hypothetical protein
MWSEPGMVKENAAFRKLLRDREAEDRQLYNPERASALLRDVFNQADPIIWDDVRKIIPHLDANIDDKTSNEPIVKTGEFLQRLIKVPFNPAYQPDYFNVTTRDLDPPEGVNKYSGYVQPYLNKEVLRTANPNTLLHERAHTLQDQPGNPMQSMMRMMQRELGHPSDEGSIPWKDRVEEQQANEFVDKTKRFMGLGVDFGLAPDDPFLKLFQGQSDSALSGPTTWPQIVR